MRSWPRPISECWPRKAAGLSYRSYVEGLAVGIERAKTDTAIEGRMIAIGVRHFGSESDGDRIRISR